MSKPNGVRYSGPNLEGHYSFTYWSDDVAGTVRPYGGGWWQATATQYLSDGVELQTYKTVTDHAKTRAEAVTRALRGLGYLVEEAQK